MNKPRFYQAILKPLTEEELLVKTNGISIDERMGENAVCTECGSNIWWLLPINSVAVMEGGKSYCECLGCGYKTHL